MKARMVVAAIVALAALATAPFDAIALAVEVAPLDAPFEGSFAVSGSDQSPVFTVTESGTGTDVGIPIGAFTYDLWVTQDLRRRPSGCGPNSSTGRQGLATLRFADGDLRLRRVTGDACFSFPFVMGTEEWVAVGGTRAYRTTTGRVSRTFQGDVRRGSVTGRWLGG